MIRIPDISMMTVLPQEPDREPFVIQCVGGHARWARELASLTLQTDIVMDDSAGRGLEYLAAIESPFNLEIGYPKHGPGDRLIVTQFFNCAAREIVGRALAVRPYGRLVRRYQMAIRAEQYVPADSSPATFDGPFGKPEKG